MRRQIIALLCFGIAFGYVEAAVVVYLRVLYEPIHQRLHPGRSMDDLFPILTVADLQAEEPRATRWVGIEVVREAATLLMLAGIGVALGRTFLEGFAGFMVAFGIWDIFFYVFLKVLIGWPGSLLDWDLLFLLPVPWSGPVLAPVVVSLSMIVAGMTVLWLAQRGENLRLSRWHWLLIVGGGVILVVAFCWDAANVTAGGLPRPFQWPLFALGEIVGFGAFLHAVWTNRRTPVTVSGGLAQAH